MDEIAKRLQIIFEMTNFREIAQSIKIKNVFAATGLRRLKTSEEEDYIKVAKIIVIKFIANSSERNK